MVLENRLVRLLVTFLDRSTLPSGDKESRDLGDNSSQVGALVLLAVPLITSNGF